VTPGPDGKRFAVVHSEGLGPLVIWVMNADGSGATRLSPATFAEYDPAWSPDGSRLAYVCNDGGPVTVCTMRADGTDRQPVGFGQHPAWSPCFRIPPCSHRRSVSDDHSQVKGAKT
jgi:TolB protein